MMFWFSRRLPTKSAILSQVFSNTSLAQELWASVFPMPQGCLTPLWTEENGMRHTTPIFPFGGTLIAKDIHPIKGWISMAAKTSPSKNKCSCSILGSRMFSTGKTFSGTNTAAIILCGVTAIPFSAGQFLSESTFLSFKSGYFHLLVESSDHPGKFLCRQRYLCILMSNY